GSRSVKRKSIGTLKRLTVPAWAAPRAASVATPTSLGGTSTTAPSPAAGVATGGGVCACPAGSWAESTAMPPRAPQSVTAASTKGKGLRMGRVLVEAPIVVVGGLPRLPGRERHFRREGFGEVPPAPAAAA